MFVECQWGIPSILQFFSREIDSLGHQSLLLVSEFGLAQRIKPLSIQFEGNWIKNSRENWKMLKEPLAVDLGNMRSEATTLKINHGAPALCPKYDTPENI